MIPGSIITLRGMSRKGKTRIKQHGANWIVRDTLVAEDGTEVLLALRSIGCICAECKKLGCQDWRNIRPKNDPDFKIVEQENHTDGN